MVEFEAVIGLETHIQLNTRSKIFCGCKADSWEDEPNSNICPVCTGLPGVLPVLNRVVVESAVLLAAAMQADSIQQVSYFARKNYFYPDLPKGYQISQYDEPLARGGFLQLPLPDGSTRLVTIEKLHIEEDAGKTIYQNDRRLIDFNRCGVPLVEMVTGPDLRTEDEVAQYLIRLRQLLRWLGISDGDMERGHIRCDANVSIRPVGSDVLNAKTEIKNVNSIENARMAVKTEIDRQIREVTAGHTIETWTLQWDEDSGSLRKMRSKETEADYRYFREPDLLPVILDGEWRDDILERLPELPLARRKRFVDQYDLPMYDAEILTEERNLSEYFEEVVSIVGDDAKTVSNWMINDVQRMIRELNVSPADLKMRPGHLAKIVQMVQDKSITIKTGKELLMEVEQTGKAPEQIVSDLGLTQVSDEGVIREIAAKIIADNPDQVKTYREGKESLMGWFVGQIMRETKGKANPQTTQSVLKDLLKE